MIAGLGKVCTHSENLLAVGHVIVMYGKVTVMGQSWDNHGTIMG